MTPYCHQCRQKIPAHDVNVAEDFAYCRACNQINPLSSRQLEVGAPVDFDEPPRGAWFSETVMELEAGVRHRTILGVLGRLVPCLFWNGIVSLFVAVNIVGTLHVLGMPVPAWLPNINPASGSGSGVGVVLFLWVFLSPFILIGLVMLENLFSCLFGTTHIRVDGNGGRIRAGVPPLGKSFTFDPDAVETVQLSRKKWTSNRTGQSGPLCIQIVADGETFYFGWDLPEERRDFMLAALRHAVWSRRTR